MEWTYRDASGKPIFQHYRKAINGGRKKRYGYRYPIDHSEATGRVYAWEYRKHPLADTLLYRLPHLLANRRADLRWTEGERDCEALVESFGVLATSHHGGAGKATPKQAEWLRGRKGRIFLVADRDPAGTYDVVRRYDLLRAVGIPKKRLRIVWPVPAFKGADARDHIEAGFGLDDFVPVKIDRLREEAATVIPDRGSGNGSFPDWWVPQEEWDLTPDELEAFKSMPVRVEPRRKR
jgi:hypothetical protein